MEHLRVPTEVSLGEVRARGFSWSPGMYRGVVIPTACVRRLGGLLAAHENGAEVGSRACLRQSSCYFIRTKALQDHSYLTQFKGDSVEPISPKAYARAVGGHPRREIKDGDVLYARGGSVGEVAIADGCGKATISSHMVHLVFAEHEWYCFAFMKHPVCRLQQQPHQRGAIRALDNFRWETLLECLVPFPSQRDAERVVRYVSVLLEAIVAKERAIRKKSDTIHEAITSEFLAGQSSTAFHFHHPTVADLRLTRRLDAAIHGREYKSKIWLVENYARGWRTPKRAGFAVTPGPSLEIKLLRTRIDSQVPRAGFYSLIIPTNISEYGTLNRVTYIGTGYKLPLLRQGDVLFGEAGFQKGRSVVLLDGIENCTTNAHGLYARRADGEIQESVFFRCIFNWYRSMGLIDLMAVGGSGGHFSPEYFDYVRIPKFPEAVKAGIVKLYHNKAAPPGSAPTMANFVAWHEQWNQDLGVWELDREMKALQAELAKVQDQIIEGKTVAVPLAAPLEPARTVRSQWRKRL